MATAIALELLSILDRRLTRDDLASLSPAERQLLASLLDHWQQLASPPQQDTPAS